MNKPEGMYKDIQDLERKIKEEKGLIEHLSTWNTHGVPLYIF